MRSLRRLCRLLGRTVPQTRVRSLRSGPSSVQSCCGPRVLSYPGVLKHVKTRVVLLAEIAVVHEDAARRLERKVVRDPRWWPRGSVRLLCAWWQERSEGRRWWHCPGFGPSTSTEGGALQGQSGEGCGALPRSFRASGSKVFLTATVVALHRVTLPVLRVLLSSMPLA